MAVHVSAGQKKKKGAYLLADDLTDRLQRGEVLVACHVQGLVGVEVLLGQHLPTGGADLAIQLGPWAWGAGGLPGRLLLVLLGLGRTTTTLLLLQGLEVPVGSEELLLLLSVWQQNQQLVEDPVEVIPKQFLAALVVLGR